MKYEVIRKMVDIEEYMERLDTVGLDKDYDFGNDDNLYRIKPQKEKGNLTIKKL